MVSHLNTIAGGHLHYLLLHHGIEVTRQVQQGTIEVDYAGLHTLQTTILVAFKGVPVGIPMDKEQKHFVEQITTEYLEGQTVGLTNAVIIGTQITNQRGADFSQRRIRNLQEASYGWVELSVDVLAMYVPPYTGSADFEAVVVEAFRHHHKRYMEDLKAGRHRPGSQVEGERGEYFLGINQVNVHSPETALSTHKRNAASNTDGLNNKIFGMAICAVFIISAVGWVCYRSSKRGGTDTEEVIYVDSTGRQFRRESAELMLSGKDPAPNNKNGKVGEVLPTLEVGTTSKKGKLNQKNKEFDGSRMSSSGQQARKEKVMAVSHHSSSTNTTATKTSTKSNSSSGARPQDGASTHTHKPSSSSAGSKPSASRSPATPSDGVSREIVSNSTRSTRVSHGGRVQSASLPKTQADTRLQVSASMRSTRTGVPPTPHGDAAMRASASTRSSRTSVPPTPHGNAAMRTSASTRSSRIGAHPSSSIGDARMRAHSMRASRTTAASLSSDARMQATQSMRPTRTTSGYAHVQASELIRAM